MKSGTSQRKEEPRRTDVSHTELRNPSVVIRAQTLASWLIHDLVSSVSDA